MSPSANTAQVATHADANQQHPKVFASTLLFQPLRFRLSQMFVWQAFAIFQETRYLTRGAYLEQTSMDLSRFSFVIPFAFYDEIVHSDPLTFGRIALFL